MSDRYISIADVLQLLRLGRRSTITLCTLDINRKTGGDRVEYKDVTIVERKTGKTTQSISAAPAINTKNPHHRFNKTLNIQTKNGDVITIHPVLIEEYNGQRVVL